MRERVFAGLAASLFLGGGIWAAVAQDLDANKSPQQLFNANCSACHRSPQGLLKSGSASGAASFLRQHYTSGPASASALAGYLASLPAADPRAARQRGEPSRAAPQLEGGPRPGEQAAAGPDQRSERQRGRAERNAQRLERAARAEAEQARAGEPRGLIWSRPTPRRPPGEPATVSADPPSILIATDPKPVVPRLAARGPGVPAPVSEIRPGATPSSRPESATAALPAPSAPGSDAATPAVSEPSASIPSAPSAVAANPPEPSTTPDGLPAYPPQLGLELRLNDSPADKSPAETASRPNGAQPGFSSPLP